MSKGLEALELLYKEGINILELLCKDIPNEFKQRRMSLYNDWKKIIEQELKEHEQYKDIEEKLGIDLVSFFTTIWFPDRDENGVNHPFPINNVAEVLKKKYGKTWALTREELE